MNRFAALAALALVCAPAANAGQVTTSAITVMDIMKACRNEDQVNNNSLALGCGGYIAGVFDAMSVTHRLCPPNNPEGGFRQVVAVALKYLNEHPEKWDWQPIYLIGEGLAQGFRCVPGEATWAP